ncbi:ATP-binding cassette domain-containing protein [Lentilactobacillus sp. SPB1-3]|uniref:ATP-binding cassette domain-containing protein n=1 Tax=Lentilactobacillus terminaliae TaxID=3003483 RepID=A0ACD5DDP0_9LACO|nr:ATP-binding cassette domain-containing protein [Lentilactobacillus sp. SPB1-3]MCZ0977686.1 ATP-binding cassette domain-containing protein [Lentilactobacillus sp. SPB1-3]
MNNDNVIEVNKISKSFDNKEVVKNISFDVRRGEIFSLLGPNGAGKTTLLKMMTTLLKPDQGTISLNGFDTIEQGQRVRQEFSVTGQSTTIDEDLSARENLLIFAKLNGLSSKDAKTRADELLSDFDLINSAEQALSTFSGGMRRRLDLAVSLIGKPHILFLDEPTTGLDPRTRLQMWQAIQKLVEQGSTIFLTTQYLEEADRLADRIALIDHGKMITIGTPDELKQQVGGMQLRIELSDQKDAKSAKVIIQKVLNQPVSVSDKSLVGSIGDPGIKSVTTILDELQNAEISINNLNIESPSLDDVFFKMTVGKN